MQIATESAGAFVLAASCCDLKRPPGAVIDGEKSSYWLTTGLFPQELVIQLGETSSIKSVDLLATGVRNIELLKCEGSQPNMWECISRAEADDADGEIQRLSLKIPAPLTATFLRLRILSGYTDFISIHKLSVVGSPAMGGAGARK